MAEHFLRLVAEGYTFDFDKRTAKTPVLGETMKLTVSRTDTNRVGISVCVRDDTQGLYCHAIYLSREQVKELANYLLSI